MLDFRLNGRSFLLDESTSVKIKWVNPACYHDKLIGDVGLGITLPDNRTNRALLGNPERFDKYSSGSDRKFPGFEILHSGVHLLRGPLVLNNGFSGWMQSEYGALREEQKEKKITEMPWPEDKIFDYNDGQPYSDAENDYNVMQIRNPGFWDGIGKEVPNNTIYIDADGIEEKRPEKISQMRLNHFNNYQWFVNNHTLPTINAGLVVSPYLFLRYFIKESLRMNRWFINRNDMTSGFYSLSLWANVAIYNNFNIIDINPTTEEVEDLMWSYEQNEMVPVGYKEVTSFNWHLSQFAYKNLLPSAKYEEMILGIQNYLNFIFRFRNDSRVDIIDRNEILSGEAIDLDRWHIGTWEKGERKNVSLKFVSPFDKNDAEFSTEYEDLSDRRADFKDAVQTHADLEAISSPELGELRLVRDEDKIYEYKWIAQAIEDVNFFETQHDVLGWEFVSCGPQPFFYGTAEEVEEIKTVFSTVKAKNHGMYYTPVVNQKGNLASNPSVFNDFSPRLISGNYFLWPNALNWDGTGGLFKNRWEKWARFWKNRLEVVAEFDLPLNMISYMVDNVTRKFRTREGEFIIEEMECEFGMNRVGRTTIKGFKI